MKRITLLLLMTLVLLVPLTAQGQDRVKKRKEMRKELQEFKMKFLAQEMDLKEDQQKQFFDTYKQMSEERIKVYKERRALEKKLADNKNATEAEYEAVTKAITAAKEQDAAIEKKYDEIFAKFLSSKQIFKMKEAEEKFRVKMHEMRHRKRGK